MTSKNDIYHVWVPNTTKNEEEYFRKFVEGFVLIWESQLDLDWAQLPDWSMVKHDVGPHLLRLPEELLPAKMVLLLQCLVVICCNFDNIPFITTYDYVGNIAAICGALVHQLVEQQEEVAGRVFLHFCCPLECLYDPYLTWRHLLLGWLADASQPAAAAGITALLEKCPHLSRELLHVLGAVISGAQHNVLCAVCPATVNIVKGVISHSSTSNKCSADQQQRSMILQFYQDSVEVVMGEWREATAQVVARVVGTLQLLLTKGSPSHENVRNIMVNKQLLDTIMPATTCVKTITSVLDGSATGKERMVEDFDAYERLFVALKYLGSPSRNLLSALLGMVTEDKESQGLQIAEVLLP
ncbi:hypothetical protein PR048_021281 [Dryococelus australis]|uniref:Uncharacterized protein n=1 Tax=Dryococelus australis TaxID=614101 RepID=A0ABQ9GXR6_9NEOP|nr:hypothetical protein PR048_021281 [Dryococelus australis]